MSKGAWKRGQVQQTAQKWQQGYGAAGPAITAGVANPKQSPTAAAIAQVNTLIQNLNAAFAGGAQSQWAQALRRAGDGAWSSGMQAYAAGGLAVKATKGAAHYAAFAQTYAPAVLQQVNSLPPRGDFAANMARAQAMASWEHGNRGKFRKLWRGQGA